ncbi:hypothetical protein [Mesorhizobium sp. M0323]|uniref:hypothetical protein n=1 Tax=Mesorhizobium sp. M0323 TaxID=2956938 RepID=UPI0033397179
MVRLSDVKDSDVGTVISLNEEREKRRAKPKPPSPAVDKAFVEVWEPIFEALELVETIRLPKTAKARELLLRGLGVLLETEKRRLGQWAR